MSQKPQKQDSTNLLSDNKESSTTNISPATANACCTFIGGNVFLGLLFPPYGLILIGASVLGACCYGGYIVYKYIRKNIKKP
jgi:hypothetical protein